jgi:hypothetical protein
MITLDMNVVSAAAMDAGNRSMRKGGRKIWNEQDFNAASAEFTRLIPEREEKR